MKGRSKNFAKDTLRRGSQSSAFSRSPGRPKWNHFPDIKQSFAAVDYTSGRFIFDIGGNKYRLIATINFEKQAFLIEGILTHEEYGRKDL